jgi:hypothetical protein
MLRLTASKKMYTILYYKYKDQLGFCIFLFEACTDLAIHASLVINHFFKWLTNLLEDDKDYYWLTDWFLNVFQAPHIRMTFRSLGRSMA